MEFFTVVIAQAADPPLSILDSLIQAFTKLGHQVVDFTPRLVVGLALLLIGILAARLIRSIITGVTARIGIDALSQRVGMTELFGRFGLTAPVSVLLGQIVFAFLILFLLKLSSDVLGVTDISAGINAIIAFLPRVVVSILILLAGMLAGGLVQNTLQARLDAKGIEYAGALAGIGYGLFMVMIITVVLSQLGIDASLLNWTVIIALATTGLTLALCLGPGLRPIAQNVVSGVYARDLFPPGTRVEFDGDSATILVVGAVATRLERDGTGEFIVVPNSQLVSTEIRASQEGKKRLEKS